jgi:hypothetical protein
MATYDHDDRWSPLMRALTPNIGALPEAKLPALNGPAPERETLRLPLVKVRSLVRDRYHNGRCVQVGDIIELRADEAHGWIQHGWAEKI